MPALPPQIIALLARLPVSAYAALENFLEEQVEFADEMASYDISSEERIEQARQQMARFRDTDLDALFSKMTPAESAAYAARTPGEYQGQVFDPDPPRDDDDTKDVIIEPQDTWDNGKL